MGSPLDCRRMLVTFSMKLPSFKSNFRNGTLRCSFEGVEGRTPRRAQVRVTSIWATYSFGPSPEKSKGILGDLPPDFPLKEALPISLMMDLGGMGTSSPSSNMETIPQPYKLECPRFDDSDLKGII